MRTKLFFILNCLLGILTFGACQSDDGIYFLTDKIVEGDINVGKQRVSQVEVGNIYTTNVTITGGTAPYTLSVKDKTMAECKMDDNILLIQALGRTGATEVTVTDTKGRQAVLGVTVKQVNLLGSVQQILTKVEDTNGKDISETDEGKGIAEEVLRDICPFKEKNMIKLICDSRQNVDLYTYNVKGTFNVYTDRSSIEGTPLKNGTFEFGTKHYNQTTDSIYQYCELLFNGTSQPQYYYRSLSTDGQGFPTTHAIKSSYSIFTLDVTDRFTPSHPDVKRVIMMVCVSQRGNYFPF